MDKNKQRSKKTKTQWFETAEYIAVAATIVGSVYTTMSQSLIWATAPMSLALLLNFFNRRRMEQIILENSVALQSHVQQLAVQVGQASRQGADTTVIQQQISYLQNQDLHLQRSLESIAQELMHTDNSEKLMQMEQALSDLSDAVTQLIRDSSRPSQSVDTNQIYADLQATIEPLQAQVIELQQRATSSPSATLGESAGSPVNLEAMAELQLQVNQSNHQVEQLAQHFVAFRDELALQMASVLQPQATSSLAPDLQAQFEHWQQQLASLQQNQAQFEQLQQQFSGLRQDQAQFEQLQHQMSRFQQQLEGLSLPNPTPSFDPDLQAQIEQLQQALIANQQPQPQIDWAELEARIEQKVQQQLSIGMPTPGTEPETQTLVSDLQRQFQQLTTQFEQSTLSLCEQIPTLIAEAVDQKVQALNEREVASSEVPNDISVSNQRSEQMQENLNQVQTQIHQLTLQLERMTLDLSESIPALITETVQQQTQSLAPQSSPEAILSSEQFQNQVQHLHAEVRLLTTQLEEIMFTVTEQMPLLIQESIQQTNAANPATIPPEQLQAFQQSIQAHMTAQDRRVEDALGKLAHEMEGIPDLVTMIVQSASAASPTQSQSTSENLFADFPDTSSESTENTPDWDAFLAELDVDNKGI
jgi:hypothetical protein